MELKKSEDLFKRACVNIPAGVSSPVRKFSEVKTPPLFIAKGEGAFVYDEDGNRYIDFMNGLGPVILGHAHPAVCSAIEKQARRGIVFAASTQLEIELAEKIVASSPCLEQIRFVCSGTEAVMSAVRLAKHYTKRTKFVKFEGSYHGHADALLGKGGNASRGGGVDAHIHENTLMCEYNNPNELEQLFKKEGDKIAAVLIEPYASNMGLVKPVDDFIKKARDLCTAYGALLIFDEVVTGFRMTYGSVANMVDVTPDLVVFGKIIGGGTPIGAYGGKKEIMQEIETGGTFQGGTFAANPLTMAAGIATLDVLKNEPVYEHINSLGTLLNSQLNAIFAKKRLGYFSDYAGSLVSLIFCPIPAMKNLKDTHSQNREVFSDLHFFLAKKGVLLAPSIHEPLFISYAHRKEHINTLAQAIEDFF